MHVPLVPREIWAELYQHAIRLRELEPWTWMEETDIFGIQDPITTDEHYLKIPQIVVDFYAVL